MFSKNKNEPSSSATSREQYQYAHKRIKQKKYLMWHLVLFIASSMLFMILDLVLEIGHQVLMKSWCFWAIIFWAFVLVIHTLNVFIIHTFMGQKWEDDQLEKLKRKQERRISELEKTVSNEFEQHSQEQKHTKPNPLPEGKI
ncbi:MAG: 2TM domain-containing protein [Ulvibacter sp.]|jgi:amino acid permease|nr:2TM domain-containing protein [Ulvibacter sp.]